MLSSPGLSSCWNCWRSCWGLVGSRQCHQRCHCPQGVAGPPGPSGPTLVLSQEQLQVSDPCPAGRALPAVLSHVLLLPGPLCTRTKKIQLLPLPPRLSLSPACAIPCLSAC